MSNNTTDMNLEEMVLSILLQGKKQEVLTVFDNVKPNDFFFDGNKRLFLLMYEMYTANEPVNMIQLMQMHGLQLKQIKLAHSITEIYCKYDTLENLGNRDTADDNITSYVKALRHKTDLRAMAKLSDEIRRCIDQDKGIEDMCHMVEDYVIALGAKANRTTYTAQEMAKIMLETILTRADKEKRKKEVVFTSFGKLNDLTGGFEKGDLIILSAASGVGKSAFAMNLVYDVGYFENKPVLYLNSEMSVEQMSLRYASIISQASHKAYRNGDVGEAELNKVMMVADAFSKKNIITTTIPDLQLTNVVAEVRRMKERYDVQLVIVDYVGRMDFLAGQEMQEWQLMEKSARTLKTMAQELQIVVVMVAQLSSNGVSLAKGASMKNECDLWLNLKRIDEQDRAAYRQFRNQELERHWNTMLEFRKARNVETGLKVPMHFHGDTLSFTDDETKAQEYLRLEQLNEEGTVL